MPRKISQPALSPRCPRATVWLQYAEAVLARLSLDTVGPAHRRKDLTREFDMEFEHRMPAMITFVNDWQVHPQT